GPPVLFGNGPAKPLIVPRYRALFVSMIVIPLLSRSAMKARCDGESTQVMSKLQLFDKPGTETSLTIPSGAAAAGKMLTRDTVATRNTPRSALRANCMTAPFTDLLRPVLLPTQDAVCGSSSVDLVTCSRGPNWSVPIEALNRRAGLFVE